MKNKKGFAPSTIAGVAFCTLALLFGFCAQAFAEGSGLGLGIILGEPTGVSAKLWLSGSVAVDAAAGWAFLNRHNHYNYIHLHGDILHHYFLPVPIGDLPLYYGIGARVRLASDEERMRVGVRVPVGLEYLFEPVPLGCFLELVPLLDLIPETRFGVNGGLGIRYYFR
ncbi:MAG: hypothetical protein ABIK49_02860 [candidate division WOR-3 bacterium]